MSDQSSRDLPPHSLPTLFQQLNQSEWFLRILTRTQTLQTLQTLFEQECPLELMGQCRVLEMKEACLMIAVDNASLAMQLQYRTRELVPALCKYTEFAGLKKIYPRVLRQASVHRLKPSSSPEPISEQTAETMQQVASKIEDPLLKEALLRFAAGFLNKADL